MSLISAPGREQKELLHQQGLEANEDGIIQFQDAAAQAPRNWPKRKKSYNIIVVCLWEFWMTAISSAGTSAATIARRDSYGFGRVVSNFAFTSVYLIGQAIGSIIFSPLSETFGRVQLYIAGGLAYCVFNIIIAAVDSDIAVFFGRFITGAASAIPATVAFGTFEDLVDSHARIWIVYLYTLAGIGGLVLGPVYSAYISFYAGWRWVFWVSAIASGIGTLASFFMHETRPAVLVAKRMKKIQKQTHPDFLQPSDARTMDLSAFVQENLSRPLKFLLTEPIVTTCAGLMAISYSLIYGLTEGITVVYTDFGFAEDTTASLPFLALLVGCIINAFPRVWDDRKLHKFRSSGRNIVPESKIDSLWTSCFALAIGLWIFAWTIPPSVAHVHWIGSMFGLVLVGYATNDFSHLLFGYMTDSYGEFAASACSAVSLARTIVAAVYPLFTYQMYTGLGGNSATTVWASIATAFCITPIVFSKYGKSLRKTSRHAIKDHFDSTDTDLEKDPNFS